MTFAQDIEEEAARVGEPILSVVIGPRGWDDSRDLVPKEIQNKVLSWQSARTLLAYGYDSGYGGVDCNSIYAYTHNWVLFVSTYDGSTCVCAIPRYPVEGEPIMPGGG